MNRLLKKISAIIIGFTTLFFFQSIDIQAQELIPQKNTQLHVSDVPEFIKVEGGTFTMGSDSGRYDEKPIHRVTVSSFSISKYPITVKQYKKFCEFTGRSMPEETAYRTLQDDHPMVYVNYHDAVAYCNWLSQEYEGDFRLPTEAEWEYAARGGQESKGYIYSGNDDLEKVAWFKDNSSEQIQPVGQKIPNELGLYDMSGNVWEWCNDGYGIDYYKYSPSQNPKGPSGEPFRVLRGGAWCHDAGFCRVAFRTYFTPDFRNNFSGFRVVLSE